MHVNNPRFLSSCWVHQTYSQIHVEATTAWFSEDFMGLSGFGKRSLVDFENIMAKWAAG